MKRTYHLALLAAILTCTTADAQFSSLRKVEDSILYHPKTAGESWMPVPFQVRVQEVWLQAGDGERIHAWWFHQPESKGAILLCHGNAGNLSHWTSPVFNLQRALRQSVLIFDYPGYGKSGGKPSEAGCYAAGDAAYNHLVFDRGIPGQHIILYGESLGGGVATELAVRRPVQALVLVRTFTSVPDMARKSVWTSSVAPLIQNRFDNLGRIPQVKAPIFIAHGNLDTLIPLTQAAKLYQSAPQPKRGHLLRNIGHNDNLPADFYQALAQFLANPTPEPTVRSTK